MDYEVTIGSRQDRDDSGGRRMDRDDSGTTKIEAPVLSAVRDGELCIAELEKMVSILDKRLSPVMHVCGPDKVGLAAPDEKSSPLAARIRKSSSIIGICVSRLHSIMDRLEI